MLIPERQELYLVVAAIVGTNANGKLELSFMYFIKQRGFI